MDELVFFTTALKPPVIEAALPGVRVRPVYSRFSLVEALVESPELVGALVDVDELTDEWTHFLQSARESFPLLPIAVTAKGGGCIEDTYCLDLNVDPSDLGTQLAEFFGGPRAPERRQNHRFAWPLRARIEGSNIEHRIAEISAGGAFLEPIAPIPGPGSRCTISIEFQNFGLNTTCEILDPRHVSSRARPGFGVRFVDLSEKAADLINRIVNDALAQMLLDPSARPQVPTIEEVEDVVDLGDEFSILA